MACGDFPECRSCQHADGDQEICDMCDDGDQWEPEGSMEAANDAILPYRRIAIKEIA